MHATTWLVPLLVLLCSYLIFALIYSSLPADHFLDQPALLHGSGQDPSDSINPVAGDRRLGITKGFYVSANVQTLLGHGDIVPVSTVTRTAVIVQSWITLIMLLCGCVWAASK